MTLALVERLLAHQPLDPVDLVQTGVGSFRIAQRSASADAAVALTEVFHHERHQIQSNEEAVPVEVT